MPDVAPTPDPALPAGPGREERLGTGLRWLATWSWRWVGVAAALAILGWLVGMLWVALFPAFLALILASVLHPVSDLLVRRTPVPRTLAAALVMLGALALIAGGVTAFAPSVEGQGDEIASDAGEGIDRLRDWAVERNLVSQDQVDTAYDDAKEKITESAGSIASGVLSGVNTVTAGLVTLVLTLVLTFLFLKDGHRFLPWVRRVSGPRAGRHLGEVLDEVWSTLGGFIRAQAIVSLIDAVLIGTALAVLGVPLAVPLAVLTFFGGFVPILGAFVVGALAVLVALVTVGFEGALILLVVIIVVQQLEGNVLHPWLQAKAMKLHAGVILLAVTVGSTLFGIAGAFLAVPVAAMVAVVLRYVSALADPPAATPPAVAPGTPAPGSPAPGEGTGSSPATT